MERESMAYDVVIVGAGPSGLAAAIRLKQLAEARWDGAFGLRAGEGLGGRRAYSLRRLPGAAGAERAVPGLAGARRADRHARDRGPVPLPHRDAGRIRLPTPPQMHNEGNYIVSLGNVVRWLGQQAEALGVEIYPGFAAAEVLYDEAGRVRGVATGDMGVTKIRRGRPQLPARHGAARQADPARRGLPRLAHQDR